MPALRPIYDRVCRAIMEPGGPTLGVITEAEILRYISAAVQDFCQSAGLTRGLFCEQIQVNKTEYIEPAEVTFSQVVFADEGYLQTDGTFDISSQDYDWQNSLDGNPSQVRFDQQAPKRLSLHPPPNWSGPFLGLTDGNEMYGTIAGAAAGASLDFQFDGPGYGVPSGDYDSSCYFAFDPGVFGAISDLCTSDYNVLVIGPNQITTDYASPDDYITEVSQSFCYYLVYGALSKIFTQNSELKDTERAKYCAARFNEGVKIAQAANSNTLFQALSGVTR